MNWQAEEDDRIDAELAAADWCDECDMPIGVGSCDGCIAVASCTEPSDDDEYDPDYW